MIKRLAGIDLASAKDVKLLTEIGFFYSMVLGEADAKYTLGLLLVQKGERDKGLSYLREDAKAHPELERPRKTIRGIESDKVQFRTD